MDKTKILILACTFVCLAESRIVGNARDEGFNDDKYDRTRRWV